jgi:hypothetical protein
MAVVVMVLKESVMRTTLLWLVMVAVVLGAARSGSTTGCLRCAFQPSDVTCAPNGGILTFNSVPPNVPAYWNLFARKRGLRSVGRLSGRLKVWSDVRDPGVPGFPGRQSGTVFWGRSARFEGTISGDRFMGVARYRGGARCTFTADLTSGLGGGDPNVFDCRSGSGELLTQGALQVQVIRLSGCRG